MDFRKSPSGREMLPEGCKLMLSLTKDGKHEDEYEILEFIGEGGSTICYRAVRNREGNKVVGRLKEFYPTDLTPEGTPVYSISRKPNGYLVPEADTEENFERLCQEYITPYRMLEQMISENPDNEIFRNFIQTGDILYTCQNAPDGRDTIYIWTPGISGKSFEDYLTEARKNLLRDPEKKLYEILHTLATLTDCIKAMHSSGLMHLDIKPSNFIVPYDSSLHINSSLISMFDINSFCPIDSDLPRPFVTDGFSAPELYAGAADNRSDIFSIGAMLFYSLLTEDGQGRRYHPGDYPQLKKLLRQSPFLRDVPCGKDDELLGLLDRILRKTLAPQPGARYGSCSDLLDDLNQASLCVSEYADDHSGRSKAPAVKDCAKDTGFALYRLLYLHPLHELESAGDHHEVLIIGSGEESRQFLDIVLQVSQYTPAPPRIRCLCPDAQAFADSYLELRPAMTSFVKTTVCGVCLSPEEKAYYGILEFEDLPDGGFKKSAVDANKALARRLWEQSTAKGKAPDYLFIDTRSDSLNQHLAGYFKDAGAPCPAAYITSRPPKNLKKEEDQRIYAVSTDSARDSFVDGMVQMAFNTHLSWSASLEGDIQNAFDEFIQDKYSFYSSATFVLCLQYILHAAGIPYSEDRIHIAEEYQRKFLDLRDSSEEVREKIALLSFYEHRRWVLEKAAAGWKPPELEGEACFSTYITQGEIKDRRLKEHPCMVFCTPATPLSSKAYTGQNLKKWDEGEIDPALDDLDRLSVELHRFFRRFSDQYRKTHRFDDNPHLIDLRTMVEALSPKVQAAFESLVLCLKNIYKGSRTHAAHLDDYVARFSASLCGLEKIRQEALEARLKALQKEFFPLVESYAYRDYKLNDEKLITAIPFILTYHFEPCMAMAFDDARNDNGRNDKIFANVASSTMINPQRITYLYSYDDSSNSDLLIRKLRAVLNYYNTRRMRCRLQVLLCATGVPEESAALRLLPPLSELEKETAQGFARLEEYLLFSADSEFDAIEEFIKRLRAEGVNSYDGSTCLFRSQLANSILIEQIMKSGIGYFELDRRKKRFKVCKNCEYLRFIPKNTSIGIDDVFSLMSAKGHFTMPEYSNIYEKLWEIYIGGYLKTVSDPERRYELGVSYWNSLCDRLSEYQSGQKPPAEFNLSEYVGLSPEEQVTIVPGYLYLSVKKILDKLQEYEVIAPGSGIEYDSSESYVVRVKAPRRVIETLFDLLNRQQHLLLESGRLLIEREIRHSDTVITISSASLDVSEVGLNPNRVETAETRALTAMLMELQRCNFITNFAPNKANPAIVSFRFASTRMKELLTDPGRLLEVYTFYETLSTGYFDDAACRYEFEWEYGGVTNELDCIFTKGFCTLFVECRGTKKLTLDHYHKLHSIAEQFGIGSVKVVVGTTHNDRLQEMTVINQRQLSRGSQLNIVTVNGFREISRIGETLASIVAKRLE